jgi:hypothetical protein
MWAKWCRLPNVEAGGTIVTNVPDDTASDPRLPVIIFTAMRTLNFLTIWGTNALMPPSIQLQWFSVVISLVCFCLRLSVSSFLYFIALFWVVTPCSLLGKFTHFVGTYGLHIHICLISMSYMYSCRLWKIIIFQDTSVLRRVFWYRFIDDLEKHTVSIFMVEEWVKHVISQQQT